MVMAYSSSSSSSRYGSDLPELPVEPHHPSCNFIFPKREFGKKKMLNFACVNIPGSRSGIGFTILRMKT